MQYSVLEVCGFSSNKRESLEAQARALRYAFLPSESQLSLCIRG